jgi:hypothetical protein
MQKVSVIFQQVSRNHCIYFSTLEEIGNIEFTTKVFTDAVADAKDSCHLQQAAEIIHAEKFLVIAYKRAFLNIFYSINFHFKLFYVLFV